MRSGLHQSMHLEALTHHDDMYQYGSLFMLQALVYLVYCENFPKPPICPSILPESCKDLAELRVKFYA